MGLVCIEQPVVSIRLDPGTESQFQRPLIVAMAVDQTILKACHVRYSKLQSHT